MSDQQRARLVRKRQLHLVDAEYVRREHLLIEVEEVALDFLHRPEQIGYYLVERLSLRPGDLEHIEERLFSIGGAPLVARVFEAAGFYPAATDAATAERRVGDLREVNDPGRATVFRGAWSHIPTSGAAPSAQRRPSAPDGRPASPFFGFFF